MVGAVSAIALVDALAKYLALELHGVQVAWGYFLGMLASLVAVLAARRRLGADLLLSHRPLLQVVRALSLVMSLSCLFFSLRYLPLAEATTIGFTAPLFIVALCGPILREPVGARRWIAVASGMLGAVVVARPGMGLLHWSASVALAGAFFFAMFNIVTRLLGKTERTETTLLYTFLVGTLALGLVMPAVWTTPRAWHWLAFLASGALGLFAHFSIVRALVLADASLVAPLNYLRLVWAVAIGAIAFGDVPDAFTLAGGAITIASGLYVVHLSVRRPA